MKKKKIDYKLFLGIVVMLLVGIGVAYAALSTTLNITFGNVRQEVLAWNVGFTGSSATATAGGTSATGRSCGTATITSDSVTVADTTLSKPDDSCIYTLTVKNSGSIPATFSTITPTPPTSISCGTQNGGNMVCGNITYRLTSDSAGNTVLTSGSTTLAAGASQTIYLVVKYTGSSLNSSAVTHTGAKFTLTYTQA